MDLASLIESLTNPTAYPHPVDKVEVRQTHISVVFLAGPFVYKIKKPVDLGFLDFSSLDKRRHFCDEEVRLNRRLAPAVYLGVVSIIREATGLRVEGQGEVVEWAVKMERLPDEATLEQRLLRGEVGLDRMDSLARMLAQFHARAECGPDNLAFRQFDVVARNVRENLEQPTEHMDVTVSRAVFDRLRTLTEDALVRLRTLIESRASRGMTRDTHGDLHLDHVYLFPERQPPADLAIIDCIEFNTRFRFTDPVADMAFLVMDLRFHDRQDLAQAFADAYFRASGDREGADLLDFYTAYRALVRAKVDGIELTEKEIPTEAKSAALVRARAHWLLALGILEKPDRRPCLLLIGGLPGSGKSTLARALSERAHFSLIRSDVVRKELAGISAQDSGRATFGEELYSAAWTERTYAECLSRAERLLFEGERVLVDASFGEEKRRRVFRKAAGKLGVPVLFLLCEASPDVARPRLENRRNDASDADVAIYHQAAERWEEVGPETRQVLHEISTDGTPDETFSLTVRILQEKGLMARSSNATDKH